MWWTAPGTTQVCSVERRRCAGSRAYPMDGLALSNLKTGQRPNPTVETLARHAQAVGNRLVLSLADT